MKKNKKKDMEYKVILHKNEPETKYDGYETDEKYDGIIEVILTFNSQKMKWILSDCSCYPSSEWIELLNFMKGNSTSNISPIVGGGGNSSWNADVNNSNFRLYFDISGSGGDSTIINEFPVDKMIPVVEQIIEKIKLME